jgi:hypothetical protein
MQAHDFRISFTPLAGVLFTVPSRYCSLSVAACSLPWTVVSPASDQVLRAWPYSGTTPSVGGEWLRDYHALWCGFPDRFACSRRTKWNPPGFPTLSYNPSAATAGALTRQWFRHHPVRSPLLRVSFSLPPATEMFQLAGCPPRKRGTPKGVSCLIRRSPDHSLQAAPQSISERCPVLHRHAAPWHPSCAHGVFPAHWSAVGQGRRSIHQNLCSLVKCNGAVAPAHLNRDDGRRPRIGRGMGS